jgi:hypothetical protein
MNKIAVVTASVGAGLPIEQSVFEGVDYHAFVDDNSGAGIPAGTMWKFHNVPQWSIDKEYMDRRHAKIFKILPHLFLPGYDYYIWIDSTHMVGLDPNQIIEMYLKDSDIALFKHPERDCVYDEADIIQGVKFDKGYNVQSQMNFYESTSYPKNNGLYELPCRIQRNTGQIQALMLTWWELICKYSSRDQLSLPFAMTLHGITPAIMPGNANGIMRNSILPQIRNSNHRRAHDFLNV